MITTLSPSTGPQLIDVYERVSWHNGSSFPAHLDLSPDACEWLLQGFADGQVQLEARCLGCSCELDQLFSPGWLMASASEAVCFGEDQTGTGLHHTGRGPQKRYVFGARRAFDSCLLRASPHLRRFPVEPIRGSRAATLRPLRPRLRVREGPDQGAWGRSWQWCVPLTYTVGVWQADILPPPLVRPVQSQSEGDGALWETHCSCWLSRLLVRCMRASQCRTPFVCQVQTRVARCWMALSPSGAWRQGMTLTFVPRPIPPVESRAGLLCRTWQASERLPLLPQNRLLGSGAPVSGCGCRRTAADTCCTCHLESDAFSHHDNGDLGEPGAGAWQRIGACAVRLSECGSCSPEPNAPGWCMQADACQESFVKRATHPDTPHLRSLT